MEKKNGNGKRSGKRVVKDLAPRTDHDVRGGGWMQGVILKAEAAANPGTLFVGPVTDLKIN